MVEDLVSRFGYLAVFVGTFVEGETFILIGGFFSHRGYLGFTSTVSVAALGAFSAVDTAANWYRGVDVRERSFHGSNGSWIGIMSFGYSVPAISMVQDGWQPGSQAHPG